jgi:hypothetical protein
LAVDLLVVVGAEQAAVGQVCGSAFGPVVVVVGLAVGGGPLAAGGDAALVAHDQDAALPEAELVGRPSEVEGLGVSVHDDGDDRGVTGEAA